MATDFLAVFRAFQGFSRSEIVAIGVQKKEQDQSKMTMKTKSRLDQFFIKNLATPWALGFPQRPHPLPHGYRFTIRAWGPTKDH